MDNLALALALVLAFAPLYGSYKKSPMNDVPPLPVLWFIPAK